MKQAKILSTKFWITHSIPKKPKTEYNITMMKSNLRSKNFRNRIDPSSLLAYKKKKKKRKEKKNSVFSFANFEQRENLVFFWKSGSVDRGRTREVDEASRGLLKVVEIRGMHKVDWKNDNWSGLVNGGSHEKRLLNDLLDTYNVLERPVGNESEPLVLSLGLTLMQIIDVVSFQTAT